jgi:hypothetical protein
MQGVFIVQSITGFDELEKTVKNHKGGVFLQQEKGEGLLQQKSFTKLMTQAQKKKYLQEERVRKIVMSAGFPLGFSQPEPILALEDLKSRVNDGTPAGSREWLIDWFTCAIRPKSKKELMRHVAENPDEVYLEATSDFGNEYQGQLTSAPHQSFSIVGPDPEKKRSWYAQIFWSEKKSAWVVQ